MRKILIALLFINSLLFLNASSLDFLLGNNKSYGFGYGATAKEIEDSKKIHKMMDFYRKTYKEKNKKWRHHFYKNRHIFIYTHNDNKKIFNFTHDELMLFVHERDKKKNNDYTTIESMGYCNIFDVLTCLEINSNHGSVDDAIEILHSKFSSSYYSITENDTITFYSPENSRDIANMYISSLKKFLEFKNHPEKSLKYK